MILLSRGRNENLTSVVAQRLGVELAIEESLNSGN